ncbi:MAG TPA: PIN domain-containing protein [Acidimicrobiales bacterium]|jgi:predicted nucleic acid-binding protein
MSGSTEPPLALADSTVAVSALVQDHKFHDLAVAAVGGHRAGIATHALLETYCRLTRYPRHRVAPKQAVALLDRAFPNRYLLSKGGTDRLLGALAAGAIHGGATYDGLIAATAAEAGLPLLTLDRRAARTYAAVGAEVHYLT